MPLGVQGHLARRGHLKMLQGRGQFLATPAHVRGGRPLQDDLSLLRHQRPGLGDRHPGHQHAARQDQGLGPGPGLRQPPVY